MSKSGKDHHVHTCAYPCSLTYCVGVNIANVWFPYNIGNKHSRGHTSNSEVWINHPSLQTLSFNPFCLPIIKIMAWSAPNPVSLPLACMHKGKVIGLSICHCHFRCRRCPQKITRSQDVLVWTSGHCCQHVTSYSKKGTNLHFWSLVKDHECYKSCLLIQAMDFHPYLRYFSPNKLATSNGGVYGPFQVF